MEVVVSDVVRDEGSVVLMQGLTTDGSDRVITFACDHRPAQFIIDALAHGNETFVFLEDWQVIRNEPMPTLDEVAGPVEVTVTMLGGAKVQGTIHEEHGDTVTVKVDGRFFTVPRTAIEESSNVG